MLNYARMRNALGELYEAYPDRLVYTQIKALAPLDKEAEKLLFYMKESGLLEMSVSHAIGGGTRLGRIAITPRGIDFLQPDGGLSSLAAPVVRIAPESLASIIDAALAARDVPADQRSLVQKSLGIAGAEGVKTVVQRLIDAGIAHAPDILRLLTLP